MAGPLASQPVVGAIDTPPQAVRIERPPVNGGEASALGRDGQVVTRRFVFEEAGESVGSSSLPLTGNTRVVPNEGATQEEATPPPLPASEGSDARPRQALPT